MSISPAERLAALPKDEQAKIYAGMSDEQAAALLADWRFWARPEQVAPELDWFIWLILTGRGWGKTRTGAESILDGIVEHFKAEPNETFRNALVGRTAADCRDVMVEGESGLAACSERRGMRMIYEPSKRRITWPDHNAVATTYSAEEPESLRGPQHHRAWADELAAWKQIVDSMGNSAWSNLTFGLRLGQSPRCVVTTTPKPIPIIKELVENARKGVNKTVMTTGSMFENAAHLAASFVRQVMSVYGNTKLSAQEIHGALLEEVEGALFKALDINVPRITPVEGMSAMDLVPTLKRVLVSVDPGFSSKATNDETGIIVLGMDQRAENLRHHLYMLDDLSGHFSTVQWARVACNAYHKWGANELLIETNLGGNEHMEEIIKSIDHTVRVEPVRATEDKGARAKGPALLYEQHRVHHVGFFGLLEAEQMSWVPGERSPNRMDALVHGIRRLMPQSNMAPATSSGARIAQTRLPSTSPVGR